jgi:CheY-like chemotaxis protein
LNFEIRDTGIGIPQQHMGKLFQAFNQVDSSVSRKYGGTGLGLVICERLVNLMGGTIKVESEYGVGSKFTFCIGAKKGGDTALKQHYEANICDGKKMLVVDDNDTNLRIIKTQLKKWKIVVTAVSSGKAALEVLSVQKDFDLVITDMQMPDMDGVTLATQIKTSQPDMPVVLLSSIGNETRKTHGHLFTSVLTKPVKHQQLFEVIAMDVKKQSLAKTDNKKALLSEDFALQYPFNMLIAEDNLMNQKLITRILNKLGYEPDLANDGQEALDLIENKTYDLILMDMQMPNIDGLEATRIIRKKYGTRPLIAAMTANAMSEDRDECIKAGMDEYISKPVNIETLMNKLIDLNKIVTDDSVARFEN